MRWTSLISSGHFIQMQKNTHSSQVHMKHSPRQTTSWVTNQTSVSLRKFKLYQASFLTKVFIRLDINYKGKKSKKNTNTWRLSNAFLNNEQVTEEIKREIKKKILETNDNENMKTQNLWNAAKAVLREKLIQYIPTSRNKKKHRVNSLHLHLKQLDKEEQKIPKISKRKESIKMRAEINEIKETIVKISKTKSWFCEKINKTDKTLARLIKEREKSNQQNQK